MSRAKRRAARRGNAEGSIFQRADARWVSSITLGFDGAGRQLRKYYYGQTRGEVAEKLYAAQKTIEAGRPVTADKQTVAQFLARWLEDVAKPNVAPKTHRTYSDLIKKHLAPGLGAIQLAKLDPQQVQHFLNALSGAGLSPATVKHCRDCLRAALNVALQWNLLVRNPAAVVKLPRRIRPKPQVYDRTQAQVFLRTIEGHRLQSLFLVALCLGMREGEVLGLGLEDLDLDNKRLEIRQALQRVDGELKLVPTKTEESQRVVRLPDLVVVSLREHLARREREIACACGDWVESGRVFTTGRGTPLEARNMLREYYKLREMSGLPKIRFQDLRHSAATLLHEAGVPSQAIRKLLGHASVRTTEEIYTHTTTDMESEAAEKMNGIISA
ncbi:MAG: site-specific integrase [Bryobacterales bacterium]|nr:site-specific integrase [Bryobacterales bacterium]